jgi:hypothetical protein
MVGLSRTTERTIRLLREGLINSLEGSRVAGVVAINTAERSHEVGRRDRGVQDPWLCSIQL